MSTIAPRLSDEQLSTLLDLIKQADSVELKLTIDEPHQQSALHGLRLDPLDAQIRQVFFFETPDLALSQAGLVVRARRVQGKGDDSVVKLRPVVPDELPRKVRESPSFVVEVDAMPGGFVCSGTMKRAIPRACVRDVQAGARATRKLFSKEQRAFFADHAPDGLELDDLTMMGPVFVLKLRMTPPEFARRLVTEVWFYPDGTRILELSTKCAPPEAFTVVAETRAFLAGCGIDTSGEQQTKTRQALEFFSRN
ncbi:hypothetical protein OJ997_10325 [Solirubrobacter phytolaccae]|uniref:Adenylate cyclase n=1 Tax=Solirubrobacter phytolaccae TaxID=1404360 RepID=A0A9X3N6K0_9ACTN|nr:hypothetical protein [Solirubrobacter phytolaccae]MDA0180688.1 hypothetical protein [Solirubrobacter phytolaccae]